MILGKYSLVWYLDPLENCGGFQWSLGLERSDLDTLEPPQTAT